MKIIAVAFVLLTTGCVSIPKPDWNPGGTKPKQYEEGKRPECRLPAQWGWIEKHEQWICAPVSACYWPTYYSPTVVYPYFCGGYCR